MSSGWQRDNTAQQITIVLLQYGRKVMALNTLVILPNSSTLAVRKKNTAKASSGFSNTHTTAIRRTLCATENQCFAELVFADLCFAGLMFC